MSSAALFRFALFLFVLLMIDLYAWRGISTALGSMGARRVLRIVYWTVSISVLLMLVFGVSRLNELHASQNRAFMYTFFGIFILFLLPKVVIVLFHGLEDFIELMRRAWDRMAPGSPAPVDPGRIRFISQVGLALAAVPFAGVFYGLVHGWRHFNVVRVPLRLAKLPAAFDGLRIVHISDMHLGSFRENTAVVRRGVELINAQQPDLVLFTGDLVNNFADEVDPWLETLAELRATFGKYAVLGNHDYGDYSRWEDDAAKQANLDRLQAHYQTMGFRVLMDEHVPVEKDGERFSLIGVQNWGTRFQQYGNLAKATAGTDPAQFRVLMSHDPTHWDAQVRAAGIDLMLAGHTHGAQFGITVNGHTYSPAQWVYRQWAGLYEHEGLRLYVNRGFGFIGFPGRVGMPPEITVLELTRA